GSTTDHGGYGFAMNTYLYPMALVPLVRYDDRFANAVGKWMLNLTNSSRLFLKQTLPASNQTNSSWSDAPSNYYSYEGVKDNSDGVSPQAGGDGTGYNSSWLNFAYGSGDVGVLGSIVSPTNVDMILQLNLLATDFFHGAADPSYLLFNPYNTMKTVQVDVGSTPVNIYDALTNRFLATNVTGLTSVSIPGQDSRSLVYTPAGEPLVDNGTNVTVDGVVVNYRSPQLDRLYWASSSSGTWDSSTANWKPSSSNNATAWTAGKVASFADGNYTVTLSGPQTIGGLYFQSGNVTIQSGTLILAADATITSDAGTQTINTSISGSFGLLKEGPGTIVLGAINTYAGLTTIDEGVIQLANNYALDFTNVDVDVDNGLSIGSLNPTLGGLSGIGNLNIGAQTLTIGNDNQSAEYAGTLSGTGQLNKIGNGGWTASGSITGSLALSISGTGAVVFSGSNNYSGSTSIASASTLTITEAGALSPNSSVINNGVLTVCATSTTRKITGTGALIVGNGAPTSLTIAPGFDNNTQDSLTLVSNSTLDITDNSFTIVYGTGPDPISSVVQELASSYAFGTWLGPGITSSKAATNPGTSVGYVDTGTQIVIRYTWIGDANLNGVVDASDLAAMSPGGNTWSSGDFNYDGVVNADDYSLLLLGIVYAHGDISTTLPEPATFVFTLPLLLAFHPRRRAAGATTNAEKLRS
ncbi:MAG TPA: autotransporter-associated beta strand repeat-containing protein, partial [Tepidisphaeraceae bacterium]|nr:autotransporter-associated beta strand repeat-containing protein [Tepidisphaeraceae bacterium]